MMQSMSTDARMPATRVNAQAGGDGREVLGLQPGEWVEVKSGSEIEGTLDARGMTGGLYYMQEMRKFEGARLRVRKRLTRLHVEGTGAMKAMNNTVLLEDTTCDGSAHQGCDACCPHMWREEWLRRA